MLRTASALTLTAAAVLFLTCSAAMAQQANLPPKYVRYGHEYQDIPDAGALDPCVAARTGLDSVVRGSHIPLPVFQDTGRPQKSFRGPDGALTIENTTDFDLSIYYIGPSVCVVDIVPPHKALAFPLHNHGGFEVAVRISNLKPALYAPQLLVQQANMAAYYARVSLADLTAAAPDTAALTVSQPVASVGQTDIQHEIATIRNGRNAPMPAPQATATNLGGQTGMALENGTSYTLTVFLSGPANQRIQLAPNSSQTVTLAPGSYEIAATVSSPGVTPFYGEELFGADTQYSERFFISTK
jgi:hypothetical protein